MRLHLVDWLHLLAINFTATFRTEGGAKKREGGREEREGGRERQEETTQETFHNSILDKSSYLAICRFTALPTLSGNIIHTDHLESH